MKSAMGPLCRLQWRVLDKRRLTVWTGVFLAAAVLGVYQGEKAANAEWSAQAEVGPSAARVAPRPDARPSDLEWDWPGGEPSPTLLVSPLRATSRGQTGRFPTAYHSAALSPTMAYIDLLWPMGGVSESATPAVFREVIGRIDVAFVLIWLLPLVVIGVGYDLLSREAEDGTLALLLSQPVTGWHVLLAKCVVLLPWLVGMAVAAYVSAGMTRAADLTARDTAHLAAGCGLIVTYVLVWLSVCALINTGRRSSAMNGLVLGGLWFGLVALAPAAVDLAVRSAVTQPSDAAADLRLRSLRSDHWNDARKGGTHDRLWDVYLNRFLEEHPEYTPLPVVPPVYNSSYNREVDPLRLTLAQYARGFYLNKRLAALMGELDVKHRRRERLLTGLRFLSPATVVSDALDRIAGTNEGRYRAFYRQVRAHVSQKAERLLPFVFRNRSVPMELRSMRFAFAEPPLAGAIVTAYLSLVGVAVVIALLVARRARRMTLHRS